MESLEASLKSVCRRVKKSLRLLHGSDCLRPSEGGLNESGFKALFQSALSDDSYHIESEFKLHDGYADLLLTRRNAPFDVAIVMDLKYCATSFIATRHFENATHDAAQLEALKQLSVLDICKLKMYWSKGYEPVSVKTVLAASKAATNRFAESLLATGMFPFVVSVSVVGIGPCLVTKIETLGRVRPLLVPSPATLFPHSHADLHRVQARMRAALATLRSTDGDVDLAAGYKSGLTLTGFKMLLMGALHDSAFFVGSAVNISASNGKKYERRLKERRRGSRREDKYARSDSADSFSRSRSRSSSPSSSRSRSPPSRDRHHHRRHHSRRHHRSHSLSSSRSRSRSPSSSRSRSRSHSRSSSSSAAATFTGRDGTNYSMRHESLGTLHLLLFNSRSDPTHAVVFHFKYVPINEVHEYNASTGTFERFGDQQFENDKEKHKRRLYVSEGLRRMASMTREELERVYVKNPSTGGDKVDTVGSIARAYTSLAFRQSQAVLEKFKTLKSVTSVSVIGVGSAMLWLQEEVQPTPFNMDAIKQQLLAVEQKEDLRELEKRVKRKKGQSEREYQQALREYARKQELKRREQLSHVRSRSLDPRESRSGRARSRSSSRPHTSATATQALLQQGDPRLIQLLADRYHDSRASHTSGKQSRARSQARDKLNQTAFW